MEQQCRFSYNELDDSLVVSCREERENVRESFMFDSFIFHLTRKGKIVGMHIREVSKVLGEHKVNPSILHEIQAVHLVTAIKENCVFIGLSIVSKQGVANLPLRVFVPQLQAEA